MDKIASIRLFLQVVRSGSFSKAAQQLGLSPTSSSRLLRELEDAIGARLLHRSTRSLSLTEAGEKLFSFYGRIIDELDAVEAEAADAAEHPPVSGRLRVALPLTFANKRLAAALCRFREACPLVELEVHLDDSPTDLISDGIDVAIRIAPALSPTTVARRLATIPIVVCASPGYVQRRGEPVSPSDLPDHDCLLYSDNAVPEEWEFIHLGEPLVQRVRGMVKANNGDLLRALAVAGEGIVLQPAFLVSDDIAAGKLIRLLGDFEPRPRLAYAVYPSGRFVPAKVRRFVDIISAELRTNTN